MVEQHPTGFGTAVATILVIVLQVTGVVELEPEVAAALLGAVAVVISAFTPRYK